MNCRNLLARYFSKSLRLRANPAHEGARARSDCAVTQQHTPAGAPKQEAVPPLAETEALLHRTGALRTDAAAESLRVGEASPLVSAAAKILGTGPGAIAPVRDPAARTLIIRDPSVEAEVREGGEALPVLECVDYDVDPAKRGRRRVKIVRPRVVKERKRRQRQEIVEGEEEEEEDDKSDRYNQVANLGWEYAPQKTDVTSSDPPTSYVPKFYAEHEEIGSYSRPSEVDPMTPAPVLGRKNKKHKIDYSAVDKKNAS